MVTLHQLKKGARKVKQFTTKTPAFKGNPYKRGICLRVDIITPKKPNSAQRKTAKIRLCNGRDLIAYIPGMGHNITKHCEVLVRGGRVPDLPGVRYHLVRQKYSFTAPEIFDRRARRSKFAKKRPEKLDEDSETTQE